MQRCCTTASRFPTLFALSLALGGAGGCALHHAWIQPGAVPVEPAAAASVDCTLLLVGDAGEPELESSEPVLDALRREASQDAARTLVVFLGDNVYPDGLALPGAADRARGEAVLRNGHYIHVTGEQNLGSGVQLSQGDLNLDTGEVTNLDVHGIFQNVLIIKASKYNRLPLLSDARTFSALFVDFPPLEFPWDLPFKERPPTSMSARFAVDSSQRITGFEFHGATFVPITVLAALGLMPPYAFGKKGVTLVPGMEGCLPGTPSAENCLSEDRYPDGLVAAPNAYLPPARPQRPVGPPPRPRIADHPDAIVILFDDDEGEP